MIRNESVLKASYWLIPLGLFVAQALFTLNSESQIRYEELAEAVRNVYWLAHRLVYDGVSSNVGYYGSLLLSYKLFGFTIFTAKFFKLFLQLVSLLFLAALLKRYLGYKLAAVPLAVIGLSPTWLYWNSLQASCGLDLQYLPIVTFLMVTGLENKKRLARFALLFLAWFLAMIAWMSYPTFILYLPILVVIFLWKIRKRGEVAKYTMVSLLAFLLPFILVLLLINNRSLLILDPQNGGGIFRGAGSLDTTSFSANLSGFMTDLFRGGKSYHFEVSRGDLSDFYPVLSFLSVLGLSVFLLKVKRFKVITILCLSLFWGALLLPSITNDPSGSPGMRRYTPVLASFYALFTLSWLYVHTQKFNNSRFKLVGIGVLSLLLIHHLIVFPINLAHLGDQSPYQYPLWFTSHGNPEESVKFLVEQTEKDDLKLVCLDGNNQPYYCRYAETYAAVAGSCLWNKLDCRQIYGYDFNTGRLIPLTVDLWSNNYFEH